MINKYTYEVNSRYYLLILKKFSVEQSKESFLSLIKFKIIKQFVCTSTKIKI